MQNESARPTMKQEYKPIEELIALTWIVIAIATRELGNE